ncbi:MAG: nucleotidyltransferase [Firmicutes bacterium]|jgi:NDP-sugar pyrophosphorylase family protein|nr:nucleotidyltransferase [Bacillota bacterium]
MTETTLVIMAAGLGSRYKGLKQIDPVGPCGEVIMEYSIHDALKAGFERVVFIIKEEFYELFRRNIGRKIEKRADTDYVFQGLEDLPDGIEVPSGREKPWGTGHAVLCCKEVVRTPFAVINADDFYGAATFEALQAFLCEKEGTGKLPVYALVGFLIENTLTEHGTVARGVCTVGEDGNLIDITERTRIKKCGEEACFTEDGLAWNPIPRGSTVSMNTWGFMPDVFDELEKGFEEFFERYPYPEILTAEYYLPEFANRLLVDNKAKIRVLRTDAQWYGVTYKEDKPVVERAISELIAGGLYPRDLWGG